MTQAASIRFQNILYEELSGYAKITLNKPPHNILDTAMIREILQALDNLETRLEIPIILFSASGEKAFCTGVDVKAHTPDKVGEMLPLFHQIFRRLISLGRVTIASVSGYALGGGCELALFCDFVVACDGAKFGQPEIDVGCFPPVAAALLPDAVGCRRALEVILTGSPLSAEEARQAGLVNQVVPREKLDETVSQLIDKLSSKSAVVLRLTREAVCEKRDREFLEALAFAEEMYLNRLATTEDAAEGIHAFLEKRKPAWKGR
ncbi:MAG: enoyl-CoA hydratase/isomerase family protein [Armatimonadetes bacterium]|nr:enoyl-CoA hydratase/isomerase family protein [Armatimonadota bacterium]